MSLTTDKIENLIFGETAKYSGPHKRGTPNSEIPLPISDAVRQLLKGWLLSLGVEPYNTNKSDQGLIRCYAAGRGWVVSKLVSGGGSTNQTASAKPSIDLGGFGDQTNALLDKNDISEPQTNLDDLVVATRVDQAKAEIKSSFDGLAQALSNQISADIKSAIDSLDLSSFVEKEFAAHYPEIESLVSNVSKKIIEKTADGIIFSTLARQRASEQSEQNEQFPPEELQADSENENSAHAQYIPKIDPNYHFDPYATKVITSAIKMGENLYAYGDTGCGKTTHIEQVCAVLNQGISRINPHDGVTREMFLGGMKLISGETKFIEGALPTAMRLGLVFLVDEISFLPPNLTALLNPVAERGGKLYIPETSEWISPAPGFCIFATDNTGGKGDNSGQYVGTEVQNTATLDRFAFCIKMNYLPEDAEIEMLRNRFPTVDPDEIVNMQKLASEIRSAFSRGELSLTLSTRKLIKFFDQRTAGFTFAEALQNTVLSWLDEDDSQLIKTMLDRLRINLFPDSVNSQFLYDEEEKKAQFQQLITGNHKLEAIRQLRTWFNLGLKFAKDLTEAYQQETYTADQIFDMARNGEAPIPF